MALILNDRVKETTTTVSTGTITLAGASTGFQSFAAVGNGNTTYYAIASQTLSEWEVGIGTYTSAGTTLSRTTVLASSNAGSLVNFSAGTKDVFVTYPSEKAVWLDASGNASALGIPAAFTGTNITGTAASLTAGNATALATARNIAGVSFNGTADIAIPLGNLSNVTLSSPTTDQLLGYNGAAWVNVAANSAGAGTGVVFYNASPVITASGTQNNIQIDTLATIPVVTAELTVTGTANAASGAVLFSAFVSAALGRTVIDAGVWDFVSWIGVDTTVGTNTVTRQVYTAIPLVTGTVTMTGTGTTRTATASAGTPFATSVIDASSVTTDASYLQTPSGLYQITARTSDTVVTIGNVPSTYTNESAVAGTVWKKLFGVTTGDINDTSPNYGLYEITVTAGSYTITAATKVGILGFFTSDTPITVHTVTITYNGTTRNTHVNTPLANLHNQLAGLNGGAASEYYHSTLAEYTGTGSGNFVRVTSPTLITPALGTPSALVGTNITGTATSFTSSNVTTNANLTGDVTSIGNATTLTNAPVIAKVLTGYTSGAGTVAATDSILQAIQKLNGNKATNANLTGVITSVGNATSIASQTGTGTKFVVDTSPTLVTPLLGTPTSGLLTNCTGLPVAGGGTGLATLTANNVILGAGTSNPTFVAPSTNGNVLTSNGTTWTSAAAAGGGVTTFNGSTTGLTPATATSGAITLGGTLVVANGGTGVTTKTGTGAVVLGTSPTLTTPVINSATFATVSGTAPLYGCRAWCIFNGTTTGTNAPTAGGNVTSVTRNGTGDYTINFTTAMPDANYALSGMGGNTTTALVCVSQPQASFAPTTSAVRIQTSYVNASLTDPTTVSVQIFR